jgi:polyisoprenoid-binding protein YceI
MSSPTTTETKRQTWTIDPAHSNVEFGVRHMMISTVTGHFTGIEGTFDLDESDFSASSVNVRIDASTIDTRNDDRDAHLRGEDFFHVEEFPAITFESRSVEGTSDNVRIVGDLTMRGTTQRVALEGEELGRGTDPWGNPRVGFKASTTVNRKDFGLTWNQALEAGGVLVGDKVRITVEIQAVPAEEGDEG